MIMSATSTFPQISKKLSLGERMILALARNPNGRETGATAHYTLDNCLTFPRKVFGNFDEWVRGRMVLDHGCGYGWQSVAMRRQSGAAGVFGLDIGEDRISHGRALARQNGCEGSVRFGYRVPDEMDGKFDVVISISAFEHYADPEGELEKMRRQLRPGGVILLAFAEPWWSPYGSHFQGYAKLPGTNLPFPWLNVLFSERALLTLRSVFRQDHPARIEDVDGGLNRMTIARFERVISNPAFQVEQLRLLAVKGLPAVTRVPVVRELLTSAAGCVLRVPSNSEFSPVSCDAASHNSQGSPHRLDCSRPAKSA
jgi:SAM-dependent methyltransferase